MIDINSIGQPALRLVFLATLVSGTTAMAGERAQVDLSISVDMTPATFVPGGGNTFSITVHNAGPDDAGASRPNEQPIAIYGSSIIFLSTQPPPLDISYAVNGGCYLFRFSEPLPNGNWVLSYSYRLDPIPAGQSRTCTSAIEFSPSTTTSIETNWRVKSLVDEEIEPSNNRFDYTFVAAPPVPPTPVPAGALWGWLVMGLGFVLAARHATTRNDARSKSPPPRELHGRREVR